MLKKRSQFLNAQILPFKAKLFENAYNEHNHSAKSPPHVALICSQYIRCVLIEWLRHSNRLTLVSLLAWILTAELDRNSSSYCSVSTLQEWDHVLHVMSVSYNQQKIIINNITLFVSINKYTDSTDQSCRTM